MQRCYPWLGIHALNILVLSFDLPARVRLPALLNIKSKARNRLDVESDIRCALSTTSPDIEQLVGLKTKAAVTLNKYN